jgi:aryl-alcohol dehydrogenase-like predicted oxidoreductase
MLARTLGNLAVSAIGYGCMGLERLEENLGAADVELSSADLRDLEDAASQIAIKGERLPEAVLKLTNG